MVVPSGGHRLTGSRRGAVAIDAAISRAAAASSWCAAPAPAFGRIVASGNARRGFRAATRRMPRPTAPSSPCCAARCLPLSRSISAKARTASARPSPSRITPTCEVIIARRWVSTARGIARFGVADRAARQAGRRGNRAARDILGDARGIDHGLEQRVRRQPVGAMRAGAGHFAAGPQALDRGAAMRVHAMPPI